MSSKSNSAIGVQMLGWAAIVVVCVVIGCVYGKYVL